MLCDAALHTYHKCALQDYGARVPVETLYADEMMLTSLVPLVKAGGMGATGGIAAPAQQAMVRDTTGGCEKWLLTRLVICPVLRRGRKFVSGRVNKTSQPVCLTFQVK